MQAVLEDELNTSQQPLLSPLTDLNESVIMLESGTAIHPDSLNDITFQNFLQSPQNTAITGDPIDQSGDLETMSGDLENKNGDPQNASGDSVTSSGDVGQVKSNAIQDLKVHLKRIEDVRNLEEAKTLDFSGIRLNDLTLREKFNYMRVLKGLRDRFKELQPETTELYKELATQTLWKGAFKMSELQFMSKEELLKHLAYVEESMTYGYCWASMNKLALAKSNIEKILQERNNTLSTNKSVNDAIQSDAYKENGEIVEEEEEKVHSENEREAMSDVEQSYKNSDQDTISKALPKKLGKKDYQTIARTTSVSTVRRGKRSIVNRYHDSTTLPTNDDDTRTLSKRKWKFRTPKTRSRRRAVSQSGGNYKDSPIFDHILDYLEFLKKLKKQRMT